MMDIWIFICSALHMHVVVSVVRRRSFLELCPFPHKYGDSALCLQLQPVFAIHKIPQEAEKGSAFIICVPELANLSIDLQESTNC